jgi:hypothetical protein
MNEPTGANLEILWELLLSRQPEEVLKAFNRLTRQEQVAVTAHLQRMATEIGWHPEQRRSALAALAALSSQPHNEKG